MSAKIIEFVRSKKEVVYRLAPAKIIQFAGAPELGPSAPQVTSAAAVAPPPQTKTILTPGDFRMAWADHLNAHAKRVEEQAKIEARDKDNPVLRFLAWKSGSSLD